MIEVKLFAFLREGREKSYQLDETLFADAGSVIDYLQIPRDEVAILLVNGRHNKPEAKLKSGDLLSLFPPTGGG